MPLSSLLAIALLLGSLSLQGIALQSRLRLDVDQRQRQAEDQLVSAAHELVAAIQRSHGCLLPLRREQWPLAGCATSSDLQRLEQGELWGSRWRLIGWQPAASPPSTPGTAVMEVLLETQGPADSSPLRSAFSLQLLADPWRASELRLRGIRGIPL